MLTSLSIRALRVLCTSSPRRSISDFRRSFCSDSSCTLLSFSCSLSFLLFFTEEEEEEREPEERKGEGVLLLLRLPRWEEKCVGEEGVEEGGEQLWEGDCEEEEEEEEEHEGESGTHGNSSSEDGDAGCTLPW